MTKHTPGPWRVAGMNSNLVYAPDGWIADIRAGTKGAHTPIVQANANLIAAAPDMLAALNLMMDDFGDHFAGPTIDAARAAIAKAQGNG